jgi:hypothetical protein
MFCPKCGKPDQKENTYCRQCGGFLAKNDNYSPEKLIKTNLTFSMMSAVLSLGLAILLYAVLGFRSDTSPLIYVVAAFLITLSAWQFSTFALGLKLKKKFTKRDELQNSETAGPNYLRAAETKELLNEADLSDVVPPSVIEATTRSLSKRVPRNLS